MMSPLFVPGTPAPKGSTRAFVVKGRAVTTNANKATKPWEQQVSAVVAEAMCNGTIEFPRPAAVHLGLVFLMPRTASEPKRSTRPHTRKPDIDKLARCAIDALTGLVFEDDSQVVHLSTSKRTASVSEQPGAWITWGPA